MRWVQQPAAILNYCTKTIFNGFSGRYLFALVVLLCGLLTPPVGALAAVTSVTPITWNVVGLDSNSPQSGPNRFPVGARVCTSSGGETVNNVTFVWDSNTLPLVPAKPIYLTLTNGINQINITTSNNSPPYCADAYFEVQVQRTSAAFETSRQYHITAGSNYSTPQPRELYVKPLVSQARNGITDLRFATTEAGLLLPSASIPAGGSFSLTKGNTYFIRMSSYTAPGGYEQLETFSTLPNTIFQFLSVKTTYTADTTSNVSSPHDMLYGDACYWEENPESPNYLSCNGDGKIGGTMNVTYEVKVIEVGGGSNPINSLIYDLSGASYHYNSDYDSGGRMILLVDPALVSISKRFSPSTIAENGASTLTITLSNPNGGAVDGVEVADLFPTITGGAMTAFTPLNPADVSNTCGGTLTNNSGATLAAGATGIKVVNAVVPAYGSCSISVKVTANTIGSYPNTAHRKILNATVSASATLTADNNYLPQPQPPADCLAGQRVPLATWTFDGMTAGQVIAPATNNYTTKATNVSYATASYRKSGTAPANAAESIVTTPTQGPVITTSRAWSATGWNLSDPATPADTDTQFRFSLDTKDYNGIQINFWSRFNANGDWQGNSAGNRLRVRYNGTALGTDDTGVSTAYANYTRPPSSTYVTNTTYGVQLFYANKPLTTNGIAYIDTVSITGCPRINATPPTIAKVFNPKIINAGDKSTLTFTIVNPNATWALPGVAFTDEFPANLVVASPLTTTNTCGNPLQDQNGNALAAGATGFRLNGGSLLAPTAPATSTSCTVSIDVTSSVASVYQNVSGFVTSTYTGANTTASGYAQDTLTVLLPPMIEKSFFPSAIYTTAYGGVSTLTFTIVNPNPMHAISGIKFTDPYPINMVVAAATPLTTNTCGGNLFDNAGTALAESDVGIRLVGGSLAAPISPAISTACTISVKVKSAVAGYLENTSGPVTHTLKDKNNNDIDRGTDTAYDTLLVTEPNPKIKLLKQVGPSATGPWVTGPSRLIIEATTQVWYRFTVENVGDKTLNTVQASDPALIIPPLLGNPPLTSCIWSDGDGDLMNGIGNAPFTLPHAGANDVPLSGLFYNDHYASCVVGPYNATTIGTYTLATDDYSNTATASGVFTDPIPDVTVTSASSAIYLISKLDLDKNVTQTNFIKAGDTLSYSYLVTNNGLAPLNAPLVIFDNKIATANISCPAVDTFPEVLAAGASTICTATYTITAADVANNIVTNTARARINGIYSPTDNVSVNKLPADLAADKRNNTANEVVAGQSFTWTLTVRNHVTAGYAVFPNGATILIDKMPNVGVAGYALVSTLKTGITGNINCSISVDKDLSCTAGIGGVTIPSHITGTVAVTNGSTTVTGTGTLFNTELSVGSILLINDVPYTFATIVSDTQATLTTNYLGATVSGLNIPASFSVQITVASLLDSGLTYPVTLANPRSPGVCKVDPNTVLIETTTANNICSNTVTSKIMPLITVIKTVSPHWDPINLFASPKVIPGSLVNYKLEIKNSGVGKVDLGTTIITDKIPANAELFVGDYDDVATASTSPVIFTDDCIDPAPADVNSSPSGLTYSYVDWANAGDSLSFSNTATPPPTFGYTPTVATVDTTTGCDLAVTYFQVKLNGEFLGTLHSLGGKPTSFCLQYRVRLQ